MVAAAVFRSLEAESKQTRSNTKSTKAVRSPTTEINELTCEEYLQELKDSVHRQLQNLCPNRKNNTCDSELQQHGTY